MSAYCLVFIIGRMSAEDATNLVRGDPETPHIVQLEILPGMYNRGGGADFRLVPIGTVGGKNYPIPI